MKTKELRKKLIEPYMKKWTTGKWVINSLGEVDVKGNVIIRNLKMSELPFKFGTVYGSFDVENNKLKSTKNFPYTVTGALLIYSYNLIPEEEYIEYRIIVTRN